MGSSISVNPTSTTTYVVTGINNNNCSTTDTVVVNVNTAPEVSFDNQVSGKTVTLTSTAVNATYYFWDFGDGNMSQDQNPVHTYVNEGYYTIMHIAGNICGNDTAYFNLGTQSVGIYEHQDNLIISIYPNPTNGLVTINFEAVHSGRVEIKISDKNGKLITNHLEHHFNGKLSKVIDLQHLSAGIYFMQMITDEQVITKKIILNK
jgi:hypothetical protein